MDYGAVQSQPKQYIQSQSDQPEDGISSAVTRLLNIAGEVENTVRNLRQGISPTPEEGSELPPTGSGLLGAIQTAESSLRRSMSELVYLSNHFNS